MPYLQIILIFLIAFNPSPVSAQKENQPYKIITQDGLEEIEEVIPHEWDGKLAPGKYRLTGRDNMTWPMYAFQNDGNGFFEGANSKGKITKVTLKWKHIEPDKVELVYATQKPTSEIGTVTKDGVSTQITLGENIFENYPLRYYICEDETSHTQCLATEKTGAQCFVFDKNHTGYFSTGGSGGFGNAFKWYREENILILVFDEDEYKAVVYKPGSELKIQLLLNEEMIQVEPGVPSQPGAFFDESATSSYYLLF